MAPAEMWVLFFWKKVVENKFIYDILHIGAYVNGRYNILGFVSEMRKSTLLEKKKRYGVNSIPSIL